MHLTILLFLLFFLFAYRKVNLARKLMPKVKITNWKRLRYENVYNIFCFISVFTERK